LTEEVECFRCLQAGELLFFSNKYPILKCPVCGQVFTGIRFRTEARQDFYDDAVYFNNMYGKSKYHPAHIWHRIVSQRRLKLLMRVVPKGKLLDIGCGYGIFLNTARNLAWTVFGVELSRPASEYAHNSFKLKIFNGEIEKANYPDHYFDVITFWDVLEHVPNPAVFLQNVKRILKQDGLIALSVPNSGSLVARIYQGKWQTLRPEQHLWHFNIKTLKQLLAEESFEPWLIAKSPFNGPNFTRVDNMVVLARPIT
jgi:2-polyprenyl-3-methyl-5-hydroxy-6-metoxy-1,4-benzoquinol methylase